MIACLKFVFLNILICLFFATNCVKAQPLPDSSEPGAIERSIRKEIKNTPREQKGKVETREKIKPGKKEGENPRTESGLVYNPKFTLDRIVFKGNTLIKEKELKDLAKKVTGREIHISELINLALEITGLYQKKGYASSFAYIPQQKINKGEALIEIVEGKIGEIRLKGNKWTRKTYLKDIILKKNALEKDKVFNVRNLKPALDEINKKDYLKGRISVEAGDAPGLTNIILEVDERPPLNFNFRWDNEGRRLVGKQRAVFYLSSENLTGFGDSIYGASVLANGTTGVIAGYKIPVGPYGTELQFDYSYSNIKLGKEFKLDRITGYSHSYSPKLVQSIHKSYRTDINTDIGFDFINSKSMNNSLGTIINQYDLRVLRSGINLKRYDSRGLWISRIENSLGFDILGASKNRGYDFPSSKFYKFYAELLRYHRLPSDSILIFRASHQFTPDKLFAAEQFQVGGVNSVRGFEPGLALGDIGFNAGIEARTPVPFLKRIVPDSKKHWADKLKLGFFYDCGLYDVLRDREAFNRDNFLQGIGVGFHFDVNEAMTASFDIGIPLGQHRLERQDVRLHFSLGTSVHKFFFKEPELL